MCSHPIHQRESLPLTLLFPLIVTLLTTVPAVAAVPLEWTLTSPAAAPFAGFGSALDLDGDRLVVGAPWQSEPDDEALHAGAAYVFEHHSGVWVQAAQLTAGDGDNEDFFGQAVAVDGDHIVVGAPWESDAVNAKLYRGAAYVFEENGGAWSQVARLDAGAAEASFSFFGHTVAIDGTTVAVGAPGDGEDLGAVHVFERISGLWTETARLDGDDPGGRFGTSVALGGDILGVAERGGSSWRAYRRGAGSLPWIETNQFVDNASGFASALDGTDARAIVGAPGDDVTVAGQVHFFGVVNSLWESEGVAAAAATDIGDRFGAAVALDGHFAVVGAPGRELLAQTEAGSAYLFARDLTGDWLESSSLSVFPAPGLRFGSAVAIDGTAIAVGAPGYAQQESEDGKVQIYRLERAARFSVSQVTGCPPMIVTFTDRSVGDIDDRTWDVDGDGIPNYTNPGLVFSHTYTSTGTYNVTLTVSGTTGSDSDVRTIYVVVSDPVWCPPTK
jgi:FG-GAP repeat/PKD domain